MGLEHRLGARRKRGERHGARAPEACRRTDHRWWRHTGPATTLWWDGFTIARNVPDADAEASSVVLMESTGERVADAHGEAAVWLAVGYEPTPTEDVLATVEAGAPPYPISPTMSLMNVALGTDLVEFLQGSESAAKALEDVEAYYLPAARTGGLLD